MRGTSVGRREGHGSPAIRLRTDDEMAAPLSLPLPFSASDPTKIVYANAKQSPNERCIVSPPPPSPSLRRREAEHHGFTIHETAGDVIWREGALCRRAAARPPGMFVICMVMVMRFWNDGNFADAMPSRFPDSALYNITVQGFLPLAVVACHAEPCLLRKIQSDTL